MTVFSPTGIKVPRFRADEIAKQFNNGKLPKHSELDEFKLKGNSGTYWAKEFAAKGVLVEKGKDLCCERTKIRLEPNDVQKMLELHEALEAKYKEKIPTDKIFYLIDPEGYTLKKGIYVLENPQITVVEHAVLGYGTDARGKADERTKLPVYEIENVLDSLPDNEIRWSYIRDGIWPLLRGKGIYAYQDNRCVMAYDMPPAYLQVLSVTEYEPSTVLKSFLSNKTTNMPTWQSNSTR
jgi:hypothetical protein